MKAEEEEPDVLIRIRLVIASMTAVAHAPESNAAVCTLQPRFASACSHEQQTLDQGLPSYRFSVPNQLTPDQFLPCLQETHRTQPAAQVRIEWSWS
ncbi:hypothetical protein SCAR479_08185 [Seiridium cardinale]|uniref:Uncharacterized protein n=1 Tax=Seiridium cardinale TaxID=138064 RepID=A0ABR2XNE5_9PEZI